MSYHKTIVVITVRAHCFHDCLNMHISSICSNKSDFFKHLESVKSWFEVRGYPNKLIEQEMEKVKVFKNANVVRQRDPRKGGTFALMYHPLFKSMGKIFNINLYLLCMNNDFTRCLPLNQ